MLIFNHFLLGLWISKKKLHAKKSQLFEKNIIFPIAMRESTQNRELTLKMYLGGSSVTSILNFIFFFEKLRLFYIRHVIFRLGFAMLSASHIYSVKNYQNC